MIGVDLVILFRICIYGDAFEILAFILQEIELILASVGIFDTSNLTASLETAPPPLFRFSTVKVSLLALVRPFESG